jgi:glycosyltransferase involved in cell wall biosynthesis
MSDISGKHFIIGVPTYNRAHLISRIVSSVQDQLHSNWTIFFVDDYSIDDTRFVILDFAENNKKIQYRQMRKVAV